MQIRNFKLYHYLASRSVRVKWALHEVVGNGFDVEKVALYDGALFTPEFLRLNPNHCVPALSITWSDSSEQHMLESAAIVAFIADAYPAAALAPLTQASRERADYQQMLQFGGTAMDEVLWQIRIHEHVLPVAERDPRTVARYRHKFAAEIEPNSRSAWSARPTSAATPSARPTASSGTPCSGPAATGCAGTMSFAATCLGFQSDRRSGLPLPTPASSSPRCRPSRHSPPG